MLKVGGRLRLSLISARLAELMPAHASATVGGMHPPCLPPALADALDLVVRVTAPATGPWWIIGSAAMALHGLDLPVADVDLLLAPQDATRVLQEHGRVLPSGEEHGPYRSEVFGRIDGGPLLVEVLGGFHVREGGHWVAVEPATRLAVGLARGAVFIPSRPELAAITRRLGRPKDLLRARMLDTLP